MQTCTIQTPSGDIFLLNAPNSVIAYQVTERQNQGYEEVTVTLRVVQQSDLRLSPLELRARLLADGFTTSRMGVIHEDLHLLVEEDAKPLKPLIFQNTEDGWQVVETNDLALRNIIQAFTQKGAENLLPSLRSDTTEFLDDMADQAKAKPKTKSK
jgi:hypothetical protein